MLCLFTRSGARWKLVAWYYLFISVRTFISSCFDSPTSLRTASPFAPWRTDRSKNWILSLKISSPLGLIFQISFTILKFLLRNHVLSTFTFKFWIDSCIWDYLILTSLLFGFKLMTFLLFGFQFFVAFFQLLVWNQEICISAFTLFTSPGEVHLKKRVIWLTKFNRRCFCHWRWCCWWFSA